MELDPEQLLAPISDDEPAGPDLEYDLDFSELMIAATPKAEAQVGDQVKEGADADFSEVLKIGRGLMDRTIDIRVAVYMAEAALNREGFPLFARIMEYIQGALFTHWDHVHPQLDEDDGDSTERMNALRGLTKSLGMGGDEPVLKQLRRAAISDSRMMGRFSLRHLSVAKGEMTPPADMDSPPDMAAITAAIKDTGEEEMEAIRSGITDALTAVRGIDSLLDERVPGFGPDFAPLIEGLQAAQTAIADVLGGSVDEAGASGGDAAGAVSDGGAPMAAASGGGVGAIANSNDVMRALDLVMEYYARNEPSSPVPLLLKRAKKLVNADFMTIMEDMAYAGLEQVRTVGGLEPSEGEY